MALVSHRQRFVYLKTHKTGSTSMELMLQPYCVPDGMEVPRATPAVITDHGVVAARHPHHADDTTGWVNHMHARQVRKRLGRLRFWRYTKIAMIRNPFDKAVSWFWHNNRGTAIPGGQDRLDLFRSFLAEKADSGHFRSARDKDWGVCHIGNRNIVDVLVPLERMAECLPEVERRIGLEPGTLSARQTNASKNKTDDLPVHAYYDEATADILRRHWNWIFEAGGYSMDPRDADRVSSAEPKLMAQMQPEVAQ